MDGRFKWKGEIVFQGTASEFNRLAEALAAYPVKVGIREWAAIARSHQAGCNRIPIEKLLDRASVNEIIGTQPRLKITFIKDIRGGIRSPHIHYEGEVILLDRERFGMLVSKVASALATARVDRISDYIEAIGPVNALADDPVPMKLPREGERPESRTLSQGRGRRWIDTDFL